MPLGHDRGWIYRRGLEATSPSEPCADQSVPLHVLLCRQAGTCIAIPLAHVVEIMRPLSCEPVPGMPRFLRGLSVVRGSPVPVVDAGMLLGAEGDVSRWVSLRAGERTLALGVDEVLGLADLDPESMLARPSLLDASADVISSVAARDSQLLVVLRATRILSESDWHALGASTGAV